MRTLIRLLLLIPIMCGCSEQPRLQSAASNSFQQIGLATHNVALAQTAPGEGKAADQSAAAAITSGRQIIYRASLNLHVQNFGEADKRITALAGDAGGFVSQFNEDRSSGTQRGG